LISDFGTELVHRKRLADDTADLHARIERGVRVLEDHLHLEQEVEPVLALQPRDRALVVDHVAGASA
jgi:heme oxygenase